MKITLNAIVTVLTLGLTAYLGGCGPADLNEVFLARMEAKDAEEASNAQQQGQNPNPQGQIAIAQPVAGGVVQLPSLNVPGPSIVEGQAPVVVNTGEERFFQRDIHHWRTIHRPQPTINNHTINNVENKRHFYHTRILNHPSESTRVFQTHQVFESQQVFPTTEATTPLVHGPGPGYPPGFGGPGYGGYHRFGRRFW